MFSFKSRERKIQDLIKAKDYEGVLELIKKNRDTKKQRDECFNLLCLIGTLRAIDTYGRVCIAKTLEEYQMLRNNPEIKAPVLYGEKDTPMKEVKGIERILETVPDTNPIKRYYTELTK